MVDGDVAGVGALVVSAGTIAFLHTFAPDHWMPFAVLARAQGWSRARLWAVTLAAGAGHVGASVLLGGVALWLGFALDAVQWLQGERGAWSLYLLVAFGAGYALWGYVRARRWRHAHAHDGAVHAHAFGGAHHHHHRHAHVDELAGRVTTWTLFVVLVLGPCEALIPLMFAGVRFGASAVAWTTLSFALTTVLTMVVLAALAHAGFARVRHAFVERHAQTLTGAAICGTALAVLWLGI